MTADQPRHHHQQQENAEHHPQSQSRESSPAARRVHHEEKEGGEQTQEHRHEEHSHQRFENHQEPTRQIHTSKTPSGIRRKGLVVAMGLILVPALGTLGFWQLDRATEKSQRLEAMAEMPELRRLPAEVPPHPRRLQLQGTLDTERIFLLDNRTRSGRAGYEALALLQPTHSPRPLLLNLGWLPAPVDRARLPELEFQPLPGTYEGWLYAPEPAFTLSATPDTRPDTWPRRIQKLDFKAMAPELQLQAAIYPGVLRLLDSPLAGADSRWKPVNMPPDRHLGYAVQWFALALAAAAWTLFFARRRPEGDA